MGFIRIKNRKNFLVSIPLLHPGSIKYREFWKEQLKRCIEGYWAIDGLEESDGYRWMPPNLYFYANIGKIKHKPENSSKTAPKKIMSPYLRDFEWEFFYDFMEARGFSGFSNDEKYTCFKDEEGVLDNFIHKSAISKDGIQKEYISPRKYLRQIFNEPLGKPLFFNNAKNYSLLTARGQGKSYCVAVGVILHSILFDGATEYSKEIIANPSVVQIFVGAAMAAKSSDLLAKTKDALDNLPGTWAKNTQEEIPAPFYKTMSGRLSPNNVKNPWIHKYSKKIAGRWRLIGSGSYIHHGVFTTENPEAAAGGRYDILVIEEQGLVENLPTILGSNEATQREGTEKPGTTLAIGTGGNIEKVLGCKAIFEDPEANGFLAFDDTWEGSGKIGRFVPAIYALNQFKDENGNTDIEAAKAYLEKRRAKKRKAKNIKTINLEIMSYPLVPSEVFLTAKGTYFPVEDLNRHYKWLIGQEALLEASWKVEFGLNEKGEPMEILSNKQIIRKFPYKNEEGTDCAIEIFIRPIKDNYGNIPYGRYIAGNDPVDDDDVNEDSSLQSTFILDTWTDKIVAEYTARPRLAKTYYEQVRRLLMFYNAKCNYERDRKGLFAHFEHKNSLYLLADTPTILQDKDLQKFQNIGNQSKGTRATVPVIKWGLELIQHWLEQTSATGSMNLFTIRSPALLQELILWKPGGNYDRVSALIMLMVYRADVYKYITKGEEIKKKRVTDDSFWNNAWYPKDYRIKAFS